LPTLRSGVIETVPLSHFCGWLSPQPVKRAIIGGWPGTFLPTLLSFPPTKFFLHLLTWSVSLLALNIFLSAFQIIPSLPHTTILIYEVSLSDSRPALDDIPAVFQTLSSSPCTTY